jgi:SSS family transporter
MTGADLFVLVTYFVTMLAVGFAFSGQKSCDMYFAGDRQVSWWLGGISFFLSNLSAFAIVVYSGMGYQYGMVALSIMLLGVPTTLFATTFFARRWRRTGVITPTEFLTTRFSSTTCQVFVWSGILPRVADEGLKIAAIGMFAAGGMQISPNVSMIVVGLIVMIYSVLGGLWAVIVTELVQFVLLTVTITLLLRLSYHAAGGWRHFTSNIPQGFFSPVSGPYTWIFLVSLFVMMSMTQSSNWPLIQKFYSARSDREARRVGWFASLITLLIPPIWVLTGMLARGFLPPNLDPQTVYARLSLTLLPIGMLGLIVAALFATTMSALSSGYNVIASILTVDVYRRLIRPNAPQKELVIVGRLLTAMIALVALSLALAVVHFRWPIFNIMVMVFGLFVPPTVMPVLAGLLTRRLSASGALSGYLCGMIVGLGLLAYNLLTAPTDQMTFEAITILISFSITTATLAIAAIWFPARGEAAERASRFFATLTRPSIPTEISVTNPTPIAGLVAGAMGVALIIVALGIFPDTRLNLSTLGIGIVFTVIGLAMILPKWLSKNSSVPVVPTLKTIEFSDGSHPEGHVPEGNAKLLSQTNRHS